MIINFIMFLFYLQFVISLQPTKLLPSETRIVHSTNSTAKSYFRNSITKDSLKQSDTYSIPCSSCNLQYIGESDDIGRRLQQHKHDIRL